MSKVVLGVLLALAGCVTEPEPVEPGVDGSPDSRPPCGNCQDGALPDRYLSLPHDGLDPCFGCAPDGTCVYYSDSSGYSFYQCVATELDCPPRTCTPECEAALCQKPYECQTTFAYCEVDGVFCCLGP